MFVNAGVQTNALGKLIRVQTVNANAVNMMNALIHRNVLRENAKTVSNCPSYDPAYELFKAGCYCYLFLFQAVSSITQNIFVIQMIK